MLFTHARSQTGTSKPAFVSLPSLIVSSQSFDLAFGGWQHVMILLDIADVSHFVHPDNPMDNEAAARGTTVYLVDKRIDMLPALLGTNLCSLRPHVERLAFSVIWVSADYGHVVTVTSCPLFSLSQELTPDADIINVRFSKSVIASKSAFTYEEAQIRKDDP